MRNKQNAQYLSVFQFFFMKLQLAFIQKALDDLGLTATETCDIFKASLSLLLWSLKIVHFFHLQIVATVLKLGNLNFVPVTNMDGTEGCRIENEYELYDVGELVKVEVDSLRSALLARWPCRLLAFNNAEILLSFSCSTFVRRIF